jgi:hypothetical protein
MQQRSFISRRGTLVIISLITIISLIILIGVIWNNRNFDNDQLNGTYEGSLTISEYSEFNIVITFDGMGNCEGTVQIDGDSRSFSNCTYNCIQNDIQITISFPNSSEQLLFIGTFEGSELLVRGTVRYYLSDVNFSEGSFVLTKNE